MSFGFGIVRLLCAVVFSALDESDFLCAGCIPLRAITQIRPGSAAGKHTIDIEYSNEPLPLSSPSHTTTTETQTPSVTLQFDDEQQQKAWSNDLMEWWKEIGMRLCFAVAWL